MVSLLAMAAGAPVAIITAVRQGHVRAEKGQWLRILAAEYDLSFTAGKLPRAEPRTSNASSTTAPH